MVSLTIDCPKNELLSPKLLKSPNPPNPPNPPNEGFEGPPMLKDAPELKGLESPQNPLKEGLLGAETDCLSLSEALLPPISPEE